MDLKKVKELRLEIRDCNGNREETYDLFYLSIDDCIEHYCIQYSITREMLVDFFVLTVVIK